MISFFLHTYYPQPFFYLGPIKIYFYGLFLFLGLIIGFLFILRFSKKYNIPGEEIFSLASWIFIFSLIGARIYYLILNWPYYQKNFSEIYKIWHGGLSFYGALLFGFLAVFLWARKNKKNLFLFLDLFVPGIILAQIIGRWGNYFNQELFGRPTGFFLGIPISLEKRPLEFLENTYFHPIFLYEGIWLFLFFIFFLLFKKGFKQNGQLLFFYLSFWSFGRCFLEFLRIDPQPIISGLRIAQIVSIIFLLIGMAGLILLLKPKPKFLKPRPLLKF